MPSVPTGGIKTILCMTKTTEVQQRVHGNLLKAETLFRYIAFCMFVRLIHVPRVTKFSIFVKLTGTEMVLCSGHSLVLNEAILTMFIL